MNKITLFIIILTTLFYFTFTLILEPFKICKKGQSVEPVSVYQMQPDLDNKLTYDYFDNHVIRLLNDYFDRKHQVVINQIREIRLQEQFRENTYNHYNNDTNANYNNNNAVSLYQKSNI